MKKVKIIGFDADDTLWVNEPYYREAENTFCTMMGNYLPPERVSMRGTPIRAVVSFKAPQALR